MVLSIKEQLKRISIPKMSLNLAISFIKVCRKCLDAVAVELATVAPATSTERVDLEA